MYLPYYETYLQVFIDGLRNTNIIRNDNGESAVEIQMGRECNLITCVIRTNTLYFYVFTQYIPNTQIIRNNTLSRENHTTSEGKPHPTRGEPHSEGQVRVSE